MNPLHLLSIFLASAGVTIFTIVFLRRRSFYSLHHTAFDHAYGNENTNIKFIINATGKCAQKTYLMFVVCVGVAQFRERKAIRETWGSRAHLDQFNFDLIFLVGLSKNNAVQKDIMSESRINSDIVQYSSLDTYARLTIKSIAMLKWAKHFCQDATFIGKVDSDVYINLDAVNRELRAGHPNLNVILGRVIKKGPVVRDNNSRYYVSHEEYKDDKYPMYLAGSLYFLSPYVVSRLYDAALDTPLIKMEDVYITGILFVKIPGDAYRYRDVPGIWNELPSPRGSGIARVLAAHRIGVKLMYVMHGEFYNPRKKSC